MIVTIGGPSGVGKSTVTRELAARLRFEYLDTGAMFRAVALDMLRRGVDLGDHAAVAAAVAGRHIEVPPGRVVVNEYQREISMVINDKSYRIAPASKIEVEVPAGDFAYQLLESGAATTRSVIKDKETVTLRIK